MPMIYRRNRGLSPTRDLDDVTRGLKPQSLDSNASLLGRTRRWWTGRSVLLASQKVYQTMWLAALVYAFLGLPVLGRILNFVRFGHRFPPLRIVQGLVVGMMQDVAIFLQASTCICLVKIFFDLDEWTPPGLAANNNAPNFPNSGFLRDRSGHTRFLPVYMPVLATEYDLRDEGMEALASGAASNHRTLLSLGAGIRPAFVARAKRAVHSLVIVTLLSLILLAATIASVADFCLQVTLHPRLNRAFVEIFFNYMKQFTASLTDEEVMTQTVVGSWTVYFALIGTLTFGFYTGRLPLATEFFRLSTPWCSCFLHRSTARKDSMASSGSSLPTSTSYVSNLFASYWHRARKPSRIRRQSTVSSTSHVPGGTQGGTSASTSSTLYTKSGPLPSLGRCMVATFLTTAVALSVSVLLNRKGGVDMKLMNNAMVTLQAEPLFYRPTPIHREELNCTAASRALLSNLGTSERYELDTLGNDDHCALLWRKTTAFHGKLIVDLHVNDTLNQSEGLEEHIPRAPPNFIVINLESWRHLDVGVLGAASTKQRTGKSATPQFDKLATTGVLYTKHYTQCVQTSRTLLTTLFGMLPSCTETTALQQYGTSLNVRGLPQFLKKRGYFNLFWSAVDLTWEYWDKFLGTNGFDKLVDDRKVRKMLHETRNFKNSPDDHFSWGIHDHLSFEMLLYAIESAQNATDVSRASSENTSRENANATAVDVVFGLEAVDSAAPMRLTGSSSLAGQLSTKKNATTAKPPLPGWEGLQPPFFIDMYSISSHNPWALPKSYATPDLSGLYTRYNKKYLDSMYFSDEMLGTFIAALRAKGLMKNTIVIIEGDHGYGRLEHGNNPSIAESGVWDEGSRVPFLLLADDFLRDEDKGTVVDQLTMQSDLMATIADILGVTPEEPLYQHGYGHSMMRRRVPPEAQEVAPAHVKEVELDQEAGVEDSETEALAAEARRSLYERRVVFCNPFNGMSKGVRTEELKYIFHPDGSYNVFEPAIDSAEKKPLRTGFDVEGMDDATRDMFEYVTKVVDLNQFLFEANRFMTPLPTHVTSNLDGDADNQVRRDHALNVTTREEVALNQLRGVPVSVHSFN